MDRRRTDHLKSFVENVELTDDLRRNRESGLTEGLPRFQRILLLIPVMILSTSFFGLSLYVAIFFAVFALIILLIRQVNLEGDAITASCPDCEGDMRKDELGSIEYFVCDRCELYAVGRDWS
ncbi:hypothetical protein V2O64_11545 [Verrucomicrobiaceae bacterium 227]